MKRSGMIRYVVLLAWGILCAATSAARAGERPAGEHVVRVGYYQIPGYHNLTATGERSGYGYDFLQLVRRYVPMEFVYMGYDRSWAQVLDMLQGGEIDLLTGALHTAERERHFDYSLPIGSTQLNLYVVNKNVRFRPGDYRSYEGMRIGTVESEMLDVRIKRMAEQNRFHCTVVDFPAFDDMERALSAGEVDAMCVIGTHLIEGFRVLDSFDNEDIYAIVRKGNTGLLDTLNDAIMQMNQSVMMWPQKLYHDNYLVDDTQELEFTERELAFIRRHNTKETAVKVAADDTWKPYSWKEDGKYRGIIIDYLDMLMKKAGLEYDFVEGSFTSEDALRTHPEAQLYVDFVSTKQYAEEQGLITSPTFMASSIALVSRKSYNQVKSVGLSANTPMLDKVARKNFTFDFEVFPSTDELIEAVLEGKVDGAMVYDYVAETHVNGLDDKRMQISFIPNMTLPMYMVARQSDERELITILSKCIEQMDDHECDKLAVQYLSTAEKEPTVWEFMKHNPWLPAGAFVLTFVVFMFEHMRRVRAIQRKDVQARKLAEAANDAKTSFLFNMSHDIRTPMNAIIGFRDLLEKHQEEPEKRADYLRKIEDASMVLLSIINNVLEMARIEKGSVELDETPWSVEQFSDVLYSIFIDMMEKKGLRFTREVNIQHPYIYCDPIKLREVFINLLSNAYKYTMKGEVRLQIDELPADREGWIFFRTTISDTGMGMSEEFLPHLFDEFAREQNTTEAKIEGTGLGMPIVKRLVDLMNGTIEVRSKKGEGTTFVVTIPHRISERSGLVIPGAVIDDPHFFEGKRILLAEDNDLNAEIAMEILGEKGFLIERAEDGKVCVDMLEAAPLGYYDLILMDIQMPNMNGYDAARTIRAMSDIKKACIPIVAMTANAFEEDKRNAQRAGMNGHLTKPIDMHELTKTLATMLHGYPPQ